MASLWMYDFMALMTQVKKEDRTTRWDSLFFQTHLSMSVSQPLTDNLPRALPGISLLWSKV